MGGGPGGSGGGWKGQGGADELRAMARFVMSYCVPVCVCMCYTVPCHSMQAMLRYMYTCRYNICACNIHTYMHTYIHTYMQLKRRQPWAPSLNRS